MIPLNYLDVISPSRTLIISFKHKYSYHSSFSNFLNFLTTNFVPVTSIYIYQFTVLYYLFYTLDH